MNDEPTVQPSPAELKPPPDFTTFMRAYQDMVYSTAVRLTGNDAQAEDISQEVFLKAFQHFDMLQTSPSAGGWLKTVATNLSINHLQRYRRRWKFFSEFAKPDDNDDSPAVEFPAADSDVLASLTQEDRRQWLEQALAKLPEHQRVPLVLFRGTRRRLYQRLCRSQGGL